MDIITYLGNEFFTKTCERLYCASVFIIELENGVVNVRIEVNRCGSGGELCCRFVIQNLVMQMK